MSENKFIKHLRGENTAKSVLEIKNQRTTTSFANMPDGDTSNANDVYSDHRGNATGVLKGTENWKIEDNDLVETATVYGDGRDFSNTTYEASGNTLWVDATCTFATPKRFTPNTKFVLKLCGHDLETVFNSTVDFTLIVKIGNGIISKTFTVTEQAFNFCKEFVIDFGESNSSTIKANAGSSMQVQLLCADANARAVIYNGMTIFTVLQRRVDSETVSSDILSLDEMEHSLTTHINDKNNPHEVTKAQVGLGNCDNTSDLDKPISTATQAALDGKVSTDGSSTMTGMLKMRATSSFQCAIAPFWDGVGFFKLNSDDSVTLISYVETTDGFVPGATNTYNIGSSLNKWKNLYLTGTAYITKINNGYDLLVPARSGTLATKDDVDLAANSGDQLTDEGVWYAKMYAATVAPSAEDGTNYADFSQTDQSGDPIIVLYERQNGAWVQTDTITPPAEYNGYVTVTSKIWDIVEQDGQQGGKVLWSHNTKTFTPYPQIISFEDAHLTGNSTVQMPAQPTGNSIVNVDYLSTHSGGTGKNVGDIFFTTRTDNGLAGAVECNGATYSTTDFVGSGNIGDLLADGKVPYVSLADYATALTTNGSVGVFGWDGTGTTAFRVPSLNDIFIETGTAAQIGDYIAPGLPNITGGTGGCVANVAPYGAFTQGGQHGTAGGGVGTFYQNVFNASRSSSIYGNSETVQPNSVKYRAMVQLATGATDEALETCTGVLADVAANKAAIAGADYVVETQLPTAANNYTWYRKYKSGWVEQGGYNFLSAYTTGFFTQTLPVEMADGNYQVILNFESREQAYHTGTSLFLLSDTNTTTSFNYTARSGNGTNYKVSSSWEVKGMAAN